jgi:hypothetical protein
VTDALEELVIPHEPSASQEQATDVWVREIQRAVAANDVSNAWEREKDVFVVQEIASSSPQVANAAHSCDGE